MYVAKTNISTFEKKNNININKIYPGEIDGWLIDDSAKKKITAIERIISKKEKYKNQRQSTENLHTNK